MNFLGIHCHYIVFVISFGVTKCTEPLSYADDEKDCPSPGDNILLQAETVPWNIKDRAFLTLPSGFIIKKSSILKAGLGVFALTFIPRHTWLGEYEGEIIDEIYNDYVWQVHRGGEVNHYIDGENVATSNWLRFLNCPRYYSEENVEMQECMGKIYYMTVKDIYPGQELMVFYGDEYAKYLGLNLSEFYDS